MVLGFRADYSLFGSMVLVGSWEVEVPLSTKGEGEEVLCSFGEGVVVFVWLG